MSCRVIIFQNQIDQSKIPPITRGEDFRPIQDGERLGQQGKFAGPTNQYREDWGQKFTQKEGNQKVFKQNTSLILTNEMIQSQTKIERG